MKSNRMIFAALALAAAYMTFTNCAGTPGDDEDRECPVCDNVTEMLVGWQCVPIDQVEACGPDGHPHGNECHCFSGQDPTEIGGADYCLQLGCGGGDDHEEDPEDMACELIHGASPELVNAVELFADFPNAHVDLEHVAEITLPAGAESYVHFPGHETTEYLLFIDAAGVFDSAYNANEDPLVVRDEGANTFCDTDIPEIWGIEVVNDTGSVKPQVVKFKAAAAGTVRVVIIEASHDH